MPDVAAANVRVCLASFNTRAVTELCLRTLRGLAGRPFELVVGDCGSTDGSLPMLERFRDATWIELDVAPEGRRHSEWLDLWLATCPCRYLVFCDSDVEFRRAGWLSEMVDTAQRNGAALVATRIQAKGGVAYTNPMTGATATLAPRPEPWLMLIDVDQVRPKVATSFGYAEERRADGTLFAFDTSAAFFRDLDAAGLKWLEMPEGFAGAFRHYGSMTWQRGAGMPFPRRLRQLAKRGLVAARLPLARIRYRERDVGRANPTEN